MVFVKMENIFSKVFSANKQRDRLFKLDAFNMIKRYAIKRNADINYKSHLIFMRLRDKYTNNLVSGY